jgi:hypothetical protein
MQAVSEWDFFVSYTQADRAWAEWIAWILEEDDHRVLDRAGAYLQVHARLTDARPLQERALAIDEAVYRPDHPTIARDLSNLAQILRDLGESGGGAAAGGTGAGHYRGRPGRRVGASWCGGDK